MLKHGKRIEIPIVKTVLPGLCRYYKAAYALN